MNFDPNEVLRRFHRALVREIQGSNPEYLSSPFSVAEIYQNLVPYRTHRDEIGAEMNADYEHALLRLLAGEGDLLTIESKTARQEIREELDSPNPNTGLYRDFAAADVRLNPDKIDQALMGDSAREPELDPEDLSEGVRGVGLEVEAPISAEGQEGFPVEKEETEGFASPSDEMPTAEETEEGPLWKAESADGSETQEVAGEEIPVEVPGESHKEDDAVMEDEASVVTTNEGSREHAAPANCAWCREALPDRPGVNFCPFCGCSVHLIPCPECGEELELNWRFCIACGTEVSS